MSTALLVVDMLNDYGHDDADKLRESARATLPAIRRLLDAAREHDVFTVYVNDNHGDWTAGRRAMIDWARTNGDPELIDPIAPAPDVPFLVKARHSAFYETQLEYLLHEEGIDRVILTGQVTEQCILYTGLDAYIRHFDVTIPRDAVAHIYEDLADASLRMMRRNMRATILDAEEAARSLESGGDAG